MKLTFRQEAGLLFVEIVGRWTAAGIHEAIGDARAEADRSASRNLLVDARAVSRPDTEVTRFFSGARWAELFPSEFRAAFLLEPALYNGFAELVARNRGANVAVFFDEASARAWLRQS